MHFSIFHCVGLVLRGAGGLVLHATSTPPVLHRIEHRQLTMTAAEWASASARSAPEPDADRVRLPVLDKSTAEADGAWELGLLPFPIAEALLPGETKQVHLYEARFTRLFESATRNHNCLGQMLIAPAGGVTEFTSLLEVEESRRQDVGVWAQLKCVGRVRLRSVRQTDYDYFVAQVALVSDKSPAAAVKAEAEAVAEAAEGEVEGGEAAADADEEEKAEAEEAEACAAEVRVAYEGCRSLALKLMQAAGEVEKADEGQSSVPDERVEWGHEARAEALRFDKSLDELLEQRRGVLLSRGLDALPATSLCEQVKDTWKAQSEEEAERQLLSYVTATYLPTAERALSMSMQDTVERLQLVLTHLRAHERKLAAQLALRQAFS